MQLSRGGHLTWDKQSKEFYHEDKMDDYYSCYDQVKDGGNRWHNEAIACPPNNIPDRAFSIYFIPKDGQKLADLSAMRTRLTTQASAAIYAFPSDAAATATIFARTTAA